MPGPQALAPQHVAINGNNCSVQLNITLENLLPGSPAYNKTAATSLQEENSLQAEPAQGMVCSVFLHSRPFAEEQAVASLQTKSELRWLSSSMHAQQTPCTLQNPLLLHMHGWADTSLKGGLAEVHRNAAMLPWLWQMKEIVPCKHRPCCCCSKTTSAC